MLYLFKVAVKKIFLRRLSKISSYIIDSFTPLIVRVIFVPDGLLQNITAKLLIQAKGPTGTEQAWRINPMSC
jgi:hypothetical protein